LKFRRWRWCLRGCQRSSSENRDQDAGGLCSQFCVLNKANLENVGQGAGTSTSPQLAACKIVAYVERRAQVRCILVETLSDVAQQQAPDCGADSTIGKNSAWQEESTYEKTWKSRFCLFPTPGLHPARADHNCGRAGDGDRSKRRQCAECAYRPDQQRHIGGANC